jgi:hypothetical protein
MDLEQYIKLRCDLNNRDYKEVRDKWENDNHTFKVEKLIKDESDNVKYSIRYTIKDYGENISKENFRYNVMICATFFVERKDASEQQNKFSSQKYDTVSMYYHFSIYQHPSNIEKVFEDTWSKLGIFSNNPYLRNAI